MLTYIACYIAHEKKTQYVTGVYVEQSDSTGVKPVPESCGVRADCLESPTREQEREKWKCRVAGVLHDALCLSEALWKHLAFLAEILPVMVINNQSKYHTLDN